MNDDCELRKEYEALRKQHNAMCQAIDADCCDISNCLVCGEPVVCVPDGMPMCTGCAEKEG